MKRAGSLEEMLPWCDFVAVHCSGGAEMRHMINARTLAEESLYNMAAMVGRGVLDVLEGRRPQYLAAP